jgi:hypothetical protein
VIEPGQEWGQTCRDRSQCEADSHIDPEQLTDLVVIDFGVLDRGLRQAEVRERLTEAGDRRDHGDESKIRRSEHVGKDDCRNRLQDKLCSLRGDGEQPTAHGPAFQVSLKVVSAESSQSLCGGHAIILTLVHRVSAIDLTGQSRLVERATIAAGASGSHFLQRIFSGMFFRFCVLEG